MPATILFDSTRPVQPARTPRPFALRLVCPEPVYGVDDLRVFRHPASAADLAEVAGWNAEATEPQAPADDDCWPTLIVGVDVPADEWPTWTDRTVFGLGRGPIRDEDLYPAGATS